MNRIIKALVAMMLLMFIFSISSIGTFAVEGDDPEIVVTDPPYTEPVYTEPVYTEPVYTEPVYTTPATQAPYNPQPATEAPYNPGVIDDSPNDDNSSSYVGGGQSSYTVPATEAPSESLYKSDDNVDEKELSDSDWKDIAGNLKNANSSDDGDDFNFIKKNESNNDNGDWMLIGGIVCLILSGAGIAYLIVDAVLKRKKLGKGNHANYSANSKKPAYAGATNNAENSADYNDNYSNDKKVVKQRRKFDTADVTLPKKSSGGRYKNGNGKRYK